MLSGERMPPLALYSAANNSGRLSPSSSSLSGSSGDPFESSTASSSANSSNSGSGGGVGGGAGYITCIDFFVPVDLACGPPDDLSCAATPRRPPSQPNSSFSVVDEKRVTSATNRGGATSANSFDERNAPARTTRKTPRGLKSLLFGDRPAVPLDLGVRPYKPQIEYVKESNTSTNTTTATSAQNDNDNSNINSKEVAESRRGISSSEAIDGPQNNAFVATPPLFSSSGYLVSPPSSSLWEDSSSTTSSSGSSSYLALSRNKPRAVVDGIECQRYNLVDREQRQEVATNLKAICLRLGPRRARRMVLPALDLLCDFEDTPPLIAQSLPAVFAACEGTTHAELFVSLIYDLCSAPDPLVSIETSSAVKTILTEAEASRDGARNVLEHFYPLLVDMTFSPYTSLRCTAASTMALLARLATSHEDRNECLQNFRYLCEDRDVTVRRSALSTLHEWLAVVSAAEWSRFPLGLVKPFLSESNHDTIRIQLAEVIVKLAAKVGRSLAAKYLFEPAVELAKDRSWRVRYIMASHIGYLYDFLSNDAAELMPTVLLLANDEEVEVRVSAAKQIGMIASLAPSATVETTLADVVNKLGQDSSPEVRAGVAKSIGPVVAACAPAVGRPLILNVMVPLLSDTTVPLVQHTAIMSIAAMAPLMAERNAHDIYSLVVVQLQTASRSTTWRVRESVANLLHHFAGHVRSTDQFDELMPIMLRLINDDSAAVRCAVVNGIPRMVACLGPAWGVKTITKLISILTDPQTSKFYQRIQVCTILSTCLPLLAKDLVAMWTTSGGIEEVGKKLSAEDGTYDEASRQQPLLLKREDAGYYYSSPVSRAVVVSPLGSDSQGGAGGGLRGEAIGPALAKAGSLTSTSSTSTVKNGLDGISSSGGGGVKARSQSSDLYKKYFSQLPNEVRVAFNTKVSEVISRFVSDRVLSVREACARLLVTMNDETPCLFTSEREAWAAAIVRSPPGFEPAADIIVKSGIPVAPSTTVRPANPTSVNSSDLGRGAADHETNPF